MPKTKYQTAQRMLKEIKVNEIGMPKLRMEIMKHCGSDERTLKSYLKLMLETKLIKDLGNSRFKLL